MTLATPNPSLVPTAAAFLLRLLCAVTLTWLAATLAALVFRRAAAALRHRLWSLSTLTALLLPALIVFLPEHRVGRIDLTPAASNAPPVITRALPAPPPAAALA